MLIVRSGLYISSTSAHNSKRKTQRNRAKLHLIAGVKYGKERIAFGLAGSRMPICWFGGDSTHR